MGDRKPNALLEQLKGSLAKPTSVSNASSMLELTQAGQGREVSLPDSLTVPPSNPAGPTNALKVSVSLYPSDLARMDEVKRYMTSLGYRNLSDSEALRLACRSISLNSTLGDVYVQMMQEDRRRKRHQDPK
jgi:hypothetical protein